MSEFNRTSFRTARDTQRNLLWKKTKPTKTKQPQSQQQQQNKKKKKREGGRKKEKKKRKKRKEAIPISFEPSRFPWWAAQKKGGKAPLL